MASRKNISALLLLFTVMIVSYSCRKEYDTINYQYVPTETKKFIFMPGSTWIYKSDTGLLYDTVVCSEISKDSLNDIIVTPKGKKVLYIQEYYKVTVKHSLHSAQETHYFNTSFDRVNVEIINNNINGQLYMFFDDNSIDINNGGNYKQQDTIINVNGIGYSTEHCRIIAVQQRKLTYTYDTDIYLCANIGLIKIFDQYNGWSLINYNVRPINF